MCPHIHFAMFKSRQLCFIKPCLPAIGTMAFLSHSRSVHLPFPYDEGSGGTRAAGQKFALLFAACSKPLTVVLMSPLIGRHKMRASLEGPC
jgi:hypothetical protein